MFCYKCGAQVPEDTNFCMKCGIKLKSSEDNSFDYINEDWEDDEEVSEGHSEVVFLGNKFILPAPMEMAIYRDIMAEIAQSYDRINYFFNSLIEKVQSDEKEHHNYGFCIQEVFWNEFCEEENSAADFFAEMIEEESENVCPEGDTPEYYGKKSNGYHSLIKLCEETRRIVRTLYFQKERSIEKGQQLAYKNALKNISGIGFGVVTNSVADLICYNAVSNAVLKSQARKADEQCRSESGAAATKAYDAFARQMNDLFYDQFVPAARQGIINWANEVTERALAFRSREGYTTFPEMMKYDKQHSNNVLAMIKGDLSEDYINLYSDRIIGFLQYAFELCPLNTEIYIKAAQIGLLDLDSIEFLKRYCLIDEQILKAIESYCIQHSDNPSILEKQCELLLNAGYRNCKYKRDILEKIFGEKLTVAINEYKEMQKAISDEKALVHYIMNKLPYNKDCVVFTHTSEESIKNDIVQAIKKIDNGVNLQLMLSNYVISYSDLIANNMGNLADINKYYSETLFSKIMDYHKKMAAEVQKYEIAKQKYEDELKFKKSELNEFEQKRKKLGWIHFSEKKELENNINNKKNEIQNYEQDKPKIEWLVWITKK